MKTQCKSRKPQVTSIRIRHAILFFPNQEKTVASFFPSETWTESKMATDKQFWFFRPLFRENSSIGNLSVHNLFFLPSYFSRKDEEKTNPSRGILFQSCLVDFFKARRLVFSDSCSIAKEKEEKESEKSRINCVRDESVMNMWENLALSVGIGFDGKSFSQTSRTFSLKVFATDLLFVRKEMDLTDSDLS